jgi:hypothetical protein
VKLSEGKATFTATLTYDTSDLWGKLEATYPITVRAN